VSSWFTLTDASNTYKRGISILSYALSRRAGAMESWPLDFYRIKKARWNVG